MPIPRYRSGNYMPILSAGFRPFFLLAGVWAAVAMVLWIGLLAGALDFPTEFAPVTWHFHELFFGFVSAAIAGFLLTAIPNWTGRLPLQGGPLLVLVVLWMVGRAAVLLSSWIAPSAVVAADLSFLILFTLAVAREIFVGRNWRNLPVVIALTLLTLANALIDLELLGWEAAVEPGKRLAISVVVMLISLIGGRIIPSFTTNWLRREGVDALPASFGRFDLATLLTGAIALLIWIVFDITPVGGALLLLAALLQTIRLYRWRGIATTREPLLWILHLGYAWLPVGLALLGFTAWYPGLREAAIHALTVGAMGTMILAVMTRASLGHSGRALSADRGTVWVYALVLVAALARLAASVFVEATNALLMVAGGSWILAFGLFVFLYAPLYLGARART